MAANRNQKEDLLDFDQPWEIKHLDELATCNEKGPQLHIERIGSLCWLSKQDKSACLKLY